MRGLVRLVKANWVLAVKYSAQLQVIAVIHLVILHNGKLCGKERLFDISRKAAKAYKKKESKMLPE